MRNGYIPLGAMVPVAHFAPIYSGVNAEIGSNLLMPPTAARFGNLQAAYQDAFHKPLPAVECYRPMVRQNATWQLSLSGGPLAAVPGDSPHGDGIAVDVGGPAGVFGTPEHAWLAANCERFGLRLAVKSEAWHLQDLDPGTMPATVDTPTEIEDEDMPLNADDKKWIADTIAATVNAEVVKVVKGSVFDGVRLGTAARDAILAAPITVDDGKGGTVTGTVAQAIRDTRNLAARAAGK